MLKDYITLLRDWKIFSGKMNKHSYWSAILILFAILAVLLWMGNSVRVFNWIALVYSIFMVIPYISATVRRLNDLNRSWYWMLLYFLPVLGWLCLFVELIQSKPRKIKNQ